MFFLVVPPLFLFLILISWLICRALGVKDLGFIIALGHLLMVVVIGTLVFLSINEAQVEFYWFIPGLIDFPMSLLIPLAKPGIAKIIGNGFFARKIFVFVIFFSLYGTFQYYLIGKLIQMQLFKRRQRKNIASDIGDSNQTEKSKTSIQIPFWTKSCYAGSLILLLLLGFLVQLELNSSRVIAKTIEFNKEIFYENKILGNITELKYGTFFQNPDKLLAVVGEKSAVFLGIDINPIINVQFKGRRFDIMNLIDLEHDNIPEFLSRGSWSTPVGLFDSRGDYLWQYQTDSGVDDSDAGDVTGDGNAEVVVGFNGGGGVHLLDSNGNKVWEKPEANVWHVEVVDTNLDGTSEIVHSNACGQIIVRDSDGEIIQKNKPKIYFSHFSLTHWAKDEDKVYLLFADDEIIYVCDFDGSIIAEYEAPQAGSGHVRGTSVTFNDNNNPYFACIVELYPMKRSMVYIYDHTHKLVYQARIPEKCCSILEHNESLLIGGNCKIWQYKLKS